MTSADNQRHPAGWLWPALRSNRPLGPLKAASFIEWRYYAILAPAFHGIVGLALVNPERRFGLVAEGGLLLIIAGLLDRPELPADAAAPAPSLMAPGPASLCWMHLFPTRTCSFDTPTPGSVRAGADGCCFALEHDDAASVRIEIEAGAGLHLRLTHEGLAGVALPPARGRDLTGPFGSKAFGAHWTVDCPAPVARSEGSLTLGGGLLADLAAAPGGPPGYATAALRRQVGAGTSQWTWAGASGYYEHSFGVRPLPLHGWDFLFVPDAASGSAAVLQTYRGSRALRYLDVCWRQDGRAHQHRFAADDLTLTWPEQVQDPVLGVRRPRVRRIAAADADYRLTLTNRVLHRLPLLRRQKLAVRHFFISEEIGIADWTLTDAAGRVLVAARGLPCGGELAHFRLRAPRVAAGRADAL
ncbi:hypothetical protein [Thiohalocapsa sp. ML1]|jgi:hypothetical protein|uniref:hypothetical protein n=1 Tax=Thiohalocapsa sp. ML1 TaxID=1431688 RepID=UPI00073214A3|nr:hypothetical protein [Thiohalocapsa sp. ML1]